jgi:hypothetical protein
MRATDKLLLVGLALVLVLGQPSPTLAQGRFSDLPLPQTWSGPAVDDLAAKGILDGYPDGTFGGRRAMTRWEFVLALWRTTVWIERELEKNRSLPAGARHPTALSGQPWFADVNPDSRHSDELGDLAAMGIIQGYPDQTFAGRRAVTQGEFAVALQRTLQWVDRELAAIKSPPVQTPAR